MCLIVLFYSLSSPSSSTFFFFFFFFVFLGVVVNGFKLYPLLVFLGQMAPASPFFKSTYIVDLLYSGRLAADRVFKHSHDYES